MDFFAKVKRLCSEKKVSLSRMANDIGISRSNPANWEKGATPQIETIGKLADYFGVPISYFTESANLVEAQTIHDNLGGKGAFMSTATDNDMTFFNNVQRLCNEKGISVTALGQELGLSNATTAGWRRGSQPRGKTLKMLADYFEVTVDQLIEDSQVTIVDNHGIIGSTHAPVTIINGSEHKLSEQAVELLNIFEHLSIVNQAKLLVYAESLKEI